MLAAPIMPTTNHKRRLSSRLDNTTRKLIPNAKRPHLESDLLKENHTIHVSPPAQLPPIKRTASLKQLSSFLHDSSLGHPDIPNSLESIALNTDFSGSNTVTISGYKKNNMSSSVILPETLSIDETSALEEGDDEIPVVKLEKNETESSSFENTYTFSTLNLTSSTTTSDVDSDGSESGRTAIPKSRIKQPAIVLVKMTQPKKKAVSAISASCTISPEFSSVVHGGYVHRMASLNARACVAAYLEPEKKFSPKCSSHGGRKKTAKTKGKSNYSSTWGTTSKISASKVEPQKSKPAILNMKNVIPVIKFESNGIEMPACAMIVEEVDEDEVPYNKVGLLYNGDTLHPNAQVFLTGDHELQLPSRVLPTLMPARLSTVKRAVRKATSTGLVHLEKKQSKVKRSWL